jgi:hypothetical protein
MRAARIETYVKCNRRKSKKARARRSFLPPLMATPFYNEGREGRGLRVPRTFGHPPCGFFRQLTSIRIVVSSRTGLLRSGQGSGFSSHTSPRREPGNDVAESSKFGADRRQPRKTRKVAKMRATGRRLFVGLGVFCGDQMRLISVRLPIFYPLFLTGHCRESLHLDGLSSIDAQRIADEELNTDLH